MRVGDFIREIENIGLINLDVIHLVGRASTNALVQDRGGGIGDAVVHAIGRVGGTIPEHLATDIGPAIPEHWNTVSVPGAGGLKVARLFFWTIKRPGHVARAARTALRAT